LIRNTKCFVISINHSEIKCRIDDSKIHETGKSGQVIVFSKTYEEAQCAIEGGCTFTFDNSVPEVTSCETEWDESTQHYHLKVKGSGISGRKEFTHFQIDGVNQECISMTQTEAVFKITDSSSNIISNLNFLWEVGRGNGVSSLPTINLTPKLISVYPKTGSAYGTDLTLNV
jgi:hypothetical protein